MQDGPDEHKTCISSVMSQFNQQSMAESATNSLVSSTAPGDTYSSVVYTAVQTSYGLCVVKQKTSREYSTSNAAAFVEI
eukprot:6306006-Amphidinium_carterae.1